MKPLELFFSFLIILLLGCSSSGETIERVTSGPQFQQQDFEMLLSKLARGWNTGDARLAADCFAEDAIYVEPPDKQRYNGRTELYEFFGGELGRSGQMSMARHHIVFDPTTQVGAGEFTFKFGGTVHGVAMIKERDGKISHWREHWYESDLDWDAFIGESAFDVN